MPRIMELNNGQLLVTIPRKLALLLRWKKGDRLEFVLNNKGKIEISKV